MDGTLQANSSPNLKFTAAGVAAADFNGDGFPDVAYTGSGYQSTLSTALDDANGTLGTPTVLDNGNYNSFEGIAAGDINGDGIEDLFVLPSRVVEGFDIYTGNGDGSFQSYRTLLSGTLRYGPALGDFNGDGIVDAAVGGVATSILMGVAPATPVITSVTPNGVVSGTIPLIVVTGANFGVGSVVEWTAPGGQTTPIVPYLQGLQQMYVTIPASAAATTGTGQLSVVNYGTLVSNTVSVPLAAFSLASVTPVKATAGSTALSVSIYGFSIYGVATSLVFTPPGGSPVSVALSTNPVTVQREGSTGSATIPATALASAGTAQVALADAQGNLSNSVPFTILPGNTVNITLSSSANTLVTGQAITLTAMVTQADASPATVVFFDGATILGQAALSGGQAAMTTRALGPGVRSLHAFYCPRLGGLKPSP